MRKWFDRMSVEHGTGSVTLQQASASEVISRWPDDAWWVRSLSHGPGEGILSD